MNRISAASVAVLMSCLCSAACGWNSAGHMAIASIAYDGLSPERRSAFVAILREHPRFQRDFAAAVPHELNPDAQDRWIFMRAATWPDLARKFDGPDQKYNHPLWHFIDLPVWLDEAAQSKIHPPVFELDPHRIHSEHAMNVVAALAESIDELKDPTVPRAQQAVALCWVLHLIGDIHQPLHAATLYSAARFREIPIGDRGGNDIPVHETQGILTTYAFPNLHGLWDCMLGTDESFLPTLDLAHQLEATYPGAPLTAEIQDLNPATWARESNRLAAEKVYTDAVRSVVEAGEAHPHAPLHPVEITADYLNSARLVAQCRAALAGYRCAALLATISAVQN